MTDLTAFLGRLAEPTPAWFSRAECRGLDPGMFYPERGANALAEKAKSVCRRCPVTAECLAHAVATGEHEGIRGGLTAQDRRAGRQSQRFIMTRKDWDQELIDELEAAHCRMDDLGYPSRKMAS